MVARSLPSFLILLAALIASGCTAVLHPPSPSAARPLAGLDADLVPGNAVEVLRNGEVFDAIEQEIREATSSVHIVLFIWRPGDPSDRITEALVARAREGVSCRVIVDPFWSVGFEAQIKPALEEAGCEVHIFKPLRDVTVPAQLVQRQHRKLVVVDGKVAFTGGFGFWKSWLGNGVGDDQWRDVAVRFRGPVVAQAQRVFGRDWLELTGRPLDDGSYPVLEFAGSSRAMFVGSEATADDAPTNAQRINSWLFGLARERIWISNSYFVPSEPMSVLLRERAADGVDVRAVVPGDRHDMRIVLAAQRSSYKALTDGGVRIYEYQASMMHSKSMLVDDRLSVIGSINLDPMSLRQARECALVVDDPEVAKALETDFMLDQLRSQPIRAPAAKPREAIARLVMWFLGSI